MAKQLNAAPIKGADGQPINVGDMVVATTKMHGTLYFGTYQGFTVTDPKRYSNQQQVYSKYTLYYKDNRGNMNHIRIGCWRAQGSPHIVSTSRIARR